MWNPNEIEFVVHKGLTSCVRVLTATELTTTYTEGCSNSSG